MSKLQLGKMKGKWEKLLTIDEDEEVEMKDDNPFSSWNFVSRVSSISFVTLAEII